MSAAWREAFGMIGVAAMIVVPILLWMVWTAFRAFSRQCAIARIHRASLESYRRWLAWHPDVSLVLDNMAAEIAGLPIGTPAPLNGPWLIRELSDKLRTRRAFGADGDPGVSERAAWRLI